jgi:hypothetical protein
MSYVSVLGVWATLYEEGWAVCAIGDTLSPVLLHVIFDKMAS